MKKLQRSFLSRNARLSSAEIEVWQKIAVTHKNMIYPIVRIVGLNGYGKKLMPKMENLFGESYTDIPKHKAKQDKNKRAWEDGFQRWSNNSFFEGHSHYGGCGLGDICDYCTDNHYGRPCVRALNSMCREKHLFIDYNDKSVENFQKWFDGGK